MLIHFPKANSYHSFKFKVSHISFSLIFTTLLYVICNAVNFEKIVKWFILGESFDYAGLIAYLSVGLCLFMAFFILFAHRWTIKPFAIIFIILSAASTYFISKYNVAIDRTMVMNTLHTDITEVSRLLSIHMIPYLLILVILSILLLAKVDITFQGSVKYLFRSLLLFTLVLGLGVGLVYLKFVSIHRAANLSKKYIIHSLVPVNFIRSIGSVIHRTVESYYRKNKKKVEISGNVTAQDNLVIVLAIGEASRQKSFSIYGYDRKNTNPELSKHKGLHTLNGIARLGSTLYVLPEITSKL